MNDAHQLKYIIKSFKEEENKDWASYMVLARTIIDTEIIIGNDKVKDILIKEFGGER